jgi:hypothetical protein
MALDTAAHIRVAARREGPSGAGQPDPRCGVTTETFEITDHGIGMYRHVGSARD